jgi:hypothetical protein
MKPTPTKPPRPYKFPGGFNYRGYCIYRSRSKRFPWFARMSDDSIDRYRTLKKWMRDVDLLAKYGDRTK